MNFLNFKSLSIVMAIFMTGLALLLGFTPRMVFDLLVLEGNDTAVFTARYGAVLFCGFAVFNWLARDAVPSPLRQSICLGMMAVMGGLAVLGFVEFARGFGGTGVLAVAITQGLFAMGYIKIWQQNAAD